MLKYEGIMSIGDSIASVVVFAVLFEAHFLEILVGPVNRSLDVLICLVLENSHVSIGTISYEVDVLVHFLLDRLPGGIASLSYWGVTILELEVHVIIFVFEGLWVIEL